MTTVAPRATAAPTANAYTNGQLGRRTPWLILVAAFAVVAIINVLLWLSGPEGGEFNVVGTVFFGFVVYAVAVVVASRIVEGPRQATNRFVTTLVIGAFVLALLPLISLLSSTIINGIPRFDLEFFNSSMRNVTGAGGGALHAIMGTLQITLFAALISVPIGLMTSIYLVEYGRGALARAITFFVDVMTGIPSIVAGLFAYLLFSIFLGPGTRTGIAGAVALSVLMIPVVVRSSEEMLRLVPNELREASYALGVPKWLTILKVVLPTSLAGITTGVMLAIARVIGETAPLLIAAGFTANMNYNVGENRMASLPVFVYNSYVSQGTDPTASIERAWTAALTLILIVMLLNLIARLIAKAFSPKLGR